jgi:uncharacterized protein YbbC (DUF1343 family)
VGAPWVDAAALMGRLKAVGTPGVTVEAVDFKPDASVFAGELCHGVKFTLTDPRQLRPVRLGIAIAQALHDQHGDTYQLEKVNKLLFHPATLQAIRDRKPLEEITALWTADEEAFRKRREGILLYPAN